MDDIAKAVKKLIDNIDEVRALKVDDIKKYQALSR